MQMTGKTTSQDENYKMKTLKKQIVKTHHKVYDSMTSLICLTKHSKIDKSLLIINYKEVDKEAFHNLLLSYYLNKILEKMYHRNYNLVFFFYF